MTGLYKIGGAVLVTILLLCFAYNHVWDAATDACNAKHREAAQAEALRQKDDVGKLKTGEAKNEEKIRESIRIIERAADPKGCGTVDAPADTLRELGGLRDTDTDSRPDRPGTDIGNP